MGSSEILTKLDIVEDDYYKALSIPKDDNLELQLKRQSLSSLLITFDDGFKNWQANIDILRVFQIMYPEFYWNMCKKHLSITEYYEKVMYSKVCTQIFHMI